VDTGDCLHVLQGHSQQVRSFAFDGIRIASGGLDKAVRVWDPETGCVYCLQKICLSLPVPFYSVCLALLEGNSALICKMQFSSSVLVTGSSDARVLTYTSTNKIANEAPLNPRRVSNDNLTIAGYRCLSEITAHTSSVTSLQVDELSSLMVISK